MISVLHIAAAVAAAAAPASTSESPLDAVIRTELAFAADTAERGGAYSFREFVAPNAVGLLPDPKTGVIQLVNAHERITSRPRPPQPRKVEMKWWPAFAGIAGSGDLAFTSGPVIFPKPNGYGFIFTLWEKQPDGSWKFYFDGGPKTDGPSAYLPTDAVKVMPAASARASSGETAQGEVIAAEQELAARAGSDLASAYLPYLSSFSLLMGSGGQPSVGARASATAELKRRGRTVAFERLGVRSAQSGDFVFTYGRAVIDGSIQGGYTRVWQKTRAGWRIVVDQIQVPEKPPA